MNNKKLNGTVFLSVLSYMFCRSTRQKISNELENKSFMKNILPYCLLLTIFLTGCQTGSDIEETFNIHEETIRKRIPPPEGYHWVTEPAGSFEEFLQNLPLKEIGSPILDYTGKKISNQSAHVGIIDYDVGKKDLQQCADAVIRLHAEYLFHNGHKDKIKYHFTNGTLFSWKDYSNGMRPKLINSNTIEMQHTATPDNSYTAFRNYLDIVFMYAGTISLNKETKPVTQTGEIKAGDILITPGSPGHAVIIVGHAKNAEGKSLYLLAEGYTPAQSIHIVTNPNNKKYNPWYELDVSKRTTRTARYLFKKTNIRRFE